MSEQKRGRPPKSHITNKIMCCFGTGHSGNTTSKFQCGGATNKYDCKMVISCDLYGMCTCACKYNKMCNPIDHGDHFKRPMARLQAGTITRDKVIVCNDSPVPDISLTKTV